VESYFDLDMFIAIVEALIPQKLVPMLYKYICCENGIFSWIHRKGPSGFGVTESSPVDKGLWTR